MSYIIENEVSTSEKIKKDLPISNELKKSVENKRKILNDILSDNDDRLILIIGPCSAWPNSALIEYAEKIKEISENVKDKIVLVLRVYTQKPRTTIGWTGPANQPDPLTPANIEKGIRYCRQMMNEVINKTNLSIADEALFTHLEGYFDDLISWMAIGARSSEDQEHRIYASMLNMPVGIKNPTSGNIDIAVNSILAAQNPHTFLLNGKQVRTSGNDYAHLVLRGGNKKPNISKENIIKTIESLKNKNIKNPSIIIDASHDNSIDLQTGKKDFRKQKEVILEIINNMNANDDMGKYIKGFMIESFLKSGNQSISDLKDLSEIDMDGLSITDPCLGLDETVKLIYEIYDKI